MLELSHLRYFSEFSRNSRLYLDSNRWPPDHVFHVLRSQNVCDQSWLWPNVEFNFIITEHSITSLTDCFYSLIHSKCGLLIMFQIHANEWEQDIYWQGTNKQATNLNSSIKNNSASCSQPNLNKQKIHLRELKLTRYATNQRNNIHYMPSTANLQYVFSRSRKQQLVPVLNIQLKWHMIMLPIQSRSFKAGYSCYNNTDLMQHAAAQHYDSYSSRSLLKIMHRTVENSKPSTTVSQTAVKYFTR